MSACYNCRHYRKADDGTCATCGGCAFYEGTRPRRAMIPLLPDLSEPETAELPGTPVRRKTRKGTRPGLERWWRERL